VDTIVLTNHSFTPGTHCIKLFVSHPADIQQTNDTVEGCYLFCFPAGVQQIGAGTSYPTFNDAITSLLNAGICGPVVFEVAPGTYNEQVVIPSIAGVDENNTITFRSANNDSTSVIITANPTASAN
jgi:pectin methylesterase-like acyl-CoA thioesterase